MDIQCSLLPRINHTNTPINRLRKIQNPVPTSKFCLPATTIFPEPVKVVIDVLTLDEELDVVDAVAASVCVEVE